MKKDVFDSSQRLLNWAWRIFKSKVVASSSFQTQSVVLLHMISEICPEMPIIFIDTTYHFPETLEFRDGLQREFSLNVRTIFPLLQPILNDDTVEPLHKLSPDLCCQLYKVKPMTQALFGMKAWVTGIRKEQTSFRRNIKSVEYRPDGLIRICPLANWTTSDMDDYIKEYKLPHHPLFKKGYLSIGCAPCTEPVLHGESERSGRWKGKSKVECGLHMTKIP